MKNSLLFVAVICLISGIIIGSSMKPKGKENKSSGNIEKEYSKMFSKLKSGNSKAEYHAHDTVQLFGHEIVAICFNDHIILKPKVLFTQTFNNYLIDTIPFRLQKGIKERINSYYFPFPFKIVASSIGVNFGGHYFIGLKDTTKGNYKTDIIDLESGKAINGPSFCNKLLFYPNSTLIEADPPDENGYYNATKGVCTPGYYKMENNRLVNLTK